MKLGKFLPQNKTKINGFLIVRLLSQDYRNNKQSRMIPLVRSVCRSLMPQVWYPLNNRTTTGAVQRNFHTVQPLIHHGINSSAQKSSTLLSPNNNLQCVPSCGLKYLRKVHRRCKDCNLMLINGVMHNFCKAHPRHKQKAITKKPKNTWILTAVTTMKKRDWW